MRAILLQRKKERNISIPLQIFGEQSERKEYTECDIRFTANLMRKTNSKRGKII